MTEQRLEKYRNVLDNAMDSQITRLILIGGACIALLYASGFLMQIIAGVVLSYKMLKTAINKPA